MKNIIKKGLILFFFSLCLPIPSTSQTTSADTLKAISLIFNEHEKLSIENPLLKQQISSLEELNQLYVKTDSLQKVEISIYKDKVDHDAKTIKKLKFSQKISIAGGIILFIIGLII